MAMLTGRNTQNHSLQEHLCLSALPKSASLHDLPCLPYQWLVVKPTTITAPGTVAATYLPSQQPASGS